MQFSKLEDHQLITQLDSQFVAEPRPAFIQAWLNNSYSHHAHIMDGSGKVKAYGALRKSDNGYRAGPIYADSTEQAADLLYALTDDLPTDELVYLDIPDCNTHFNSFVKILGLHGL